MKPYKSHFAIGAGFTCFCILYELACCAAPFGFILGYTDFGGAVWILLISFAVSAAVALIVNLFYEVFSWHPEVKHAVGETEVFVDGKTYPLTQITALYLQVGEAYQLRTGKADTTPCLLIILFADGSCCAATNPSMFFIHRLRKLNPKAKIKLENPVDVFVLGPVVGIIAGIVFALLVKSGILPE